MFSDFFIIFYWWLILLFFGFLFLPLVFGLFKKFWDKGWIFSKTLGIIIVSYLIFIFGRLHLFPFFKETILLVIFLILLGNIWWLNQKKHKKEFWQIFKDNWQKFLLEEIIFFLCLTFWAFIRGFQPDIEGLEKFMDFGFVNSILRSTWFPPADMWFANQSINYYYFGHLQAAVLTKISGLDSAITYNLMMATVFALTFASAFSLASNLAYIWPGKKLKIKNLVLVGLISALLLTLGGNLHSAVYVLKSGKDKYWYPDSTRFIGHQPNNPNDKTIHEFPLYSFVVADLHGHMNDIPTVLLFLAVLLVIGLDLVKKSKKIQNSKFKIQNSLPAFLLAVMYMTNSWDFPIYGVLLAIFLFFVFYFKHPTAGIKYIFNSLRKTFLYGVIILVLSILFALPFALSFKPMANGITFVNARSLWWQLLVLWGFFWFVSLGFWAFVIKKLTIQPFNHLTIPDILVLSATVWATILIIIPEIIYVKDIYIPEYHRANTMFKLVYQSFVIYALSSGYIFWRIKNFLLKKNFILYTLYFILFLAGFSAHMIYPYFAIKGYYGSLENYRGLYGMKFLDNLHPDNYQAVLWLKENVKGQPVILEAVGDSYTLYNHVSSMTGLPTVEGWLVHEWLWRGGYDQPGARSTEVEAIYQGEDEQYARNLLSKYKVQYVFLGDLEREKYPELGEERFAQWGKVIFSSGEVKIYYLDRLN